MTNEAKVSIEVGLDDTNTKKALTSLEGLFGRFGNQVRERWSGIDSVLESSTRKLGGVTDALRSGGSKVEAALSLGAKAAGLFSVAVVGVGVAVNKAFDFVRDGARAVEELGEKSGLSAEQIRTLKNRADDAETAFDRLKGVSALWLSDLTSKFVPFVDTAADKLIDLRNALDDVEESGEDVVKALGKLGPSAQLQLTQGPIDYSRDLPENLRTDGLSWFERQKIRASLGLPEEPYEESEVFGENEPGVQVINRRLNSPKPRATRDTKSDFLVEQVGLATMEQTRRADAYIERVTQLQIQYDQMIAKFHEDRKQVNDERILRIESQLPSWSEFESSAVDTIADSLERVLRLGVGGALQGKNVVPELAQVLGDGLSDVLSKALNTSLIGAGMSGPLLDILTAGVGGLLGGFVDGIVAIFADEREDAERLAREREETKRREQEAQRERARFFRDRKREQLDPFAGFQASPTLIYNVSFNGPIGGSPRRVARELSDLLASGSTLRGSG